MPRWGSGTCATIAVIAALAPLALARQAPSPLDELNRLEGSLPEGVQAVVTIRNAAAGRVTPAGRALGAMLRESDRFAEAGQAWRALADSLRWSPGEAFDELLGRRVTIAARRLDPSDAGDWALIGEVSRAAEERLRLSLRPAPRAVVAGLTVLAVEDGAFELSISSRSAGDQEPPVSTFMLAPAGSSHLLEEVIALLGRTLRPGTIAAGSAPTIPVERCTAFAMVRAEPGDGNPPGRSLAMTAALDPANTGAFHVRLLLSSGGGPGAGDLPEWPRSLPGPLERDALLATVGVAGLSPFEQFGQMLGLPGVSPARDALDPMPGRRIAVVIREERALPTLDAADNRAPLLADLGDPGGRRPTVIGAHRHPTGGILGHRPLSITLAVEIPDLGRTIPRTDALAARLDPILRAEEASPVDPVLFDLGLPDQFVRHAALEPPTAEAWRGVLGEAPVVRWGYTRSPAPAVSARGARDFRGPSNPDPGWWIIGLEPGDGEGGSEPARARTVEQARSVLSQARPDAGADARRRVSVGAIRPRDIERWLTAMDPALSPRIAPLRWIDSAHWDTWLTGYNAIEGEITIRMHPPR